MSEIKLNRKAKRVLMMEGYAYFVTDKNYGLQLTTNIKRIGEVSLIRIKKDIKDRIDLIRYVAHSGFYKGPTDNLDIFDAAENIKYSLNKWWKYLNKKFKNNKNVYIVFDIKVLDKEYKE